METQTATLIFGAGIPRSPVEIDPSDLEIRMIEFLELHGDEPLVPPSFKSLIGEGDGESKLTRLLGATGFGADQVGFFREIIGQLESANGERPTHLMVGGVELPAPLVLAVLEALIPGDEVFNVKTVRRLEGLTNIRVPGDARAAVQEVLDLYPVRLSSHVIRQMRLSPHIAYQYMPFAGELDGDGEEHTWVGQFHRGVIEQMYRNRVIFVLNMSCPVYCRFCFRKHKECRTQRAPTQKHVDLGVAYIRECPEIKEIVLTGGDPFVNRPTLTRAVDRLGMIPHVETLRLATRSLAFHPALFFAKDGFWLNYLARKQLELRQKGKRLEVATHFIHPDEISVQSLDAISELVGSGVPVYVQTPFLGGCNDSGDEMTELFSKLRGAGAEMHYIFMPCSPILGNDRYLSTISQGIDAAASLRRHLSDRAIPHLCTATAIGKIDWGTSGWVVGPDDDDPRYLWIRTPYTSEFFETFAPILDLSRVTRPNAEGTLDAKFLVELGNRKWQLGPDGSRVGGGARAEDRRPGEIDAVHALAELRSQARVPSPSPSPIDTGSPSLVRPHLTRVEIDCEASEDDLTQHLRYLSEDRRITDVVLFSERDPVRTPQRTCYLIEELAAIANVTAVRLRSQGLDIEPKAISDGKLKRLRSLNRLAVVRPMRVEVEMHLFHSSELCAEHERVTKTLLRRGVTLYNCTPLLSFVNDTPKEIARISGGCRRMGIEFHHLVVAGSPIQRGWNRENPIRITNVIDIASHLRLKASGRELPRYVIQTDLGEVDFGLTGTIVANDPGAPARVRLLAYDEDYYRSMDPGFEFPSGTEIDHAGHPIAEVQGLGA